MLFHREEHQYLYSCTSKASKLYTTINPKPQRQYLYSGTSKTSKLYTTLNPKPQRQYLYSCTSKASKLSTCRALLHGEEAQFVLLH